MHVSITTQIHVSKPEILFPFLCTHTKQHKKSLQSIQSPSKPFKYYVKVKLTQVRHKLPLILDYCMQTMFSFSIGVYFIYAE